MKKKETVLSVVQELRDIFKQRLSITVLEKPICSKDGRFVRNADGTVTDKQLNLIWYPTLPEKFKWEQAKQECEKIGCRLPTRKELESLLDLAKYKPAIDKEMFPDTKTDDYYWTSDTCAWGTGYAWYVGLKSGNVYYYNKDYTSYVRPVRSSQ